MTKNTALKAEVRSKAGKGSARATRRAGNVPAVIYGGNKEPVMISITQKDLVMAVSEKAFLTSVFDIDVEGKVHSVVPRDVQLHPVSDIPLHADFLRVSDKTIIRVSIPVNLINHKDCPGVVKGAVINLVRHELEVTCSAKNIPSEFKVDLTGLDVGSSVHISEITMPEGVVPTEPEKLTVLTVVAPSSMKSEEDSGVSSTEEGAEGEEAATDAATPEATATEEKK